MGELDLKRKVYIGKKFDFDWNTENYKAFRSALESDVHRLFFDLLYHAGLRIGYKLPTPEQVSTMYQLYAAGCITAGCWKNFVQTMDIRVKQQKWG